MPGLPQLDGGLLLTDGGIETTLIFDAGLDLPLFAAFTLLDTPEGTQALRDYYAPYLEVAARHDTGFVLETPTWRASPNWARQLGYADRQLDALNRAAVGLVEEIRRATESVAPLLVSGCIGPSDDGYRPSTTLTSDEAEAYHAVQIGTFASTSVDLVTAITMTYAQEAIGVVRAARAAGLPVVVSFTVETDGRLPSGQSLADAIAEVDADRSGGPDHYMINCAHPTHFAAALERGAPWTARIRGLRVNASRLSHAELDEAETLDRGDPAELGREHRELKDRLPSLAVVGGCCGTDHTHVDAIAAALLGSFGRATP
jgi:homocysteine S-methyltransferase